MKMMKTYAILTAFLQAFLWLGVRRVAIETQAYLRKIWDTEVRFPPLSELAYAITPYAWMIPAVLLATVITRWRKDDTVTTHAFAVSNVIFLTYLAMCAVGFAMPFIPKLSEFRP